MSGNSAQAEQAKEVDAAQTLELITLLLAETPFKLGEGDDVLGKVNAALSNCEDMAKVAVKLEELGYAVPEGAAIGDAACVVLDQLVTASAQAEEQLAGVKRQLAAQKGQVTKARNEAAETQEALAAAIARDPEAKLRKLPSDPPVFDRKRQDALRKVIGDAEDLELVAFLGDVEAGDVPALALRKGMSGFKVIGSGLLLAIDSWLVTGPARLDGWALYADDELLLYRKRSAGQLQIGAGQSFNLAHDVLL
ncbi:MAG: hypothetical protein VX309_03890 [Pseudomonadota bacterium]|nr:hypothetical protein [Pseudomonadota bacterium]MEE3154649.1 hypothetical protein [Pseudomonadota bacterium]